MRIARTRDGVALCFDEFEYNLFRRRTSLDGRLRCNATVDPTESVLRVRFGEGRAFSTTPGSRFWRVLLEAGECRANRLEEFGLTPTTYSEVVGKNQNIDKWRLDVAIPEVRALLKRAGRAQPIASATYVRLPTPVEAPPASDDNTSAELRLVQDLFNRAVEAGFEPKFDGKGRIIWFERRYGAALD